MNESSHPPVTFLEGQRLFLSPIRREDSHLYEIWLNDAAVANSLQIHRPLSHEEEVKLIDQLASLPIEKGLVLGIRLKDDGRLIGNLGIHDVNARDRHAMLGIFIGEKDLWGRGYGREALSLLIDYAFHTLNLRKVWLFYQSNNERGRRLYDSLGFVEVGRMREHSYVEGVWRDLVYMELFRRDDDE